MGLSPAFTPFRLRSLTLRNRVIQAATFEGMGKDGAPTPALVEHHRQLARGGAAMTTLACCAVAPDGRSHPTGIVMRREIVGGLREITAAVHHERAAASLQLSHCGYFTDAAVIGTEPIAPSAVYNRARRSRPRAMTESDISRVIGDFARSAALAVEAGFDAIELLFGHGHLVSQFLSPFTNRREDRWGGSFDNRARLAIEITRVVRSAVGTKLPVLAKVNLHDGFDGGLELAEGVKLAAGLASEGVDALIPTGGCATKTPLFMVRGEVPVVPLAAARRGVFRKLGTLMFSRLFIQEYPFQELFFLAEASQLKKRVKVPVVLVGGVKTRNNLDVAMREGFELVGMARALVHEPGLVNQLASGGIDGSGCVPCNECFAAIEGGGVKCTRRR